MANKKICSERVTVGDQMLSFRDYSFYVLGADGQPRRVRHYKDMLRISPDGFIHDTKSAGAPALGVLALPKGADVSLADITEILTYGARYGAHPGRDVVSDILGSSSGACFGGTADYRRNQRHRIPDGRSFTGEGGLGFLRPPAVELSMLLHSDRSSDAFYESAESRGKRRRSLVARLAAEDPAKITDVVAAVRSSGMRVPAIITAVDAIVAGVESSSNLLASVLTRPDDPAVALKYFQEAYPGRKTPSGLKRALADAATRLYDESACIRFDVTRLRGVEDRATSSRSVSFRDVILVARPEPRDEEQSALFASVLSGYTDVAGFPLLDARRSLQNIGPENARAEIVAAAARASEARRAGRRVDEALARLPWQMLVSLSATPREDVAEFERDLDAVRASIRSLRHADEHHDIYAQERRLRHAVRDAADGLSSFTTSSIRRSVTTGEVAASVDRSLVTLEREDLEIPEWLSLLDEFERDGYLTPDEARWQQEARLRLAARGLQAPSSDVTQFERRTEAYRAACEALAEFRAGDEFTAFRAALRPLEKQRADLESKLERARRVSRPVDPEIWQLTAPSMSAVEALSLLGAMGRSGVAEELRDVVEARVASGNYMLPDILRAARGATLTENEGVGQPDPYGVRSSQGWASLPASSWDPMLESLLQRRLDDRIGRVRGRAAIFVDGSGSMFSEVSARTGDARAAGYSSLNCAEVAAFAAAAIASRCEITPDVFAYDTTATRVDLGTSSGVLDAVRSVSKKIRGGGTDTERVVADNYDGHDFVIVLTDEQTSWVPGQPLASRFARYQETDPTGPTKSIPAGVPVVVVNLAGYQVSESGDRPGFVGISGWSEALFDTVSTISAQFD
jgi:hypothetical protein